MIPKHCKRKLERLSDNRIDVRRGIFRHSENRPVITALLSRLLELENVTIMENTVFSRSF